MKRLWWILLLPALWTTGPRHAFGQFYQYRDDKGNVVISDRQPQDRDATEHPLKDGGISWSSRQERDIPAAADGASGRAAKDGLSARKPDYSGVTVVMYRTNWCGYCNQAATYVRTLGARLVEIDIDKDLQKKAEMRKKSGGSIFVPVLDIDGTIIRGYNPPAIKAAVEKSAAR